MINKEKTRCTAALDVKQNEIGSLTAALQQKTREASDLNIRSELLGILAGKNKMLMRVKVLQMKAFMSFKKYFEWKKYKKVLASKSQKDHRLKVSKLVFQAWQNDYKGWKEIKEQDRFEIAVKREVQSISSHYAKEIETLQQRLNEATSQVQAANRSKAAMEENMKKIFMKGIFAMNMEAYNVLGDQPNNSMELEIEKQIKLAMDASP
jgi:centrosomal protein POC5